jgi:hypothetical protein
MMAMKVFSTVIFGLALASDPNPPAAAPDPPPSLRGSPAAMAQQHRIAQEHGLPFFETRAAIMDAVRRGELVELAGDENYEVADFVDPPYIRAEALTFVERTAALYRQACGERLVVTSAVRPRDEQPANAHRLSVHPAGMAVDLRVSANAECREWLEAKMLELEEQRLINGIREFRPPHYHIAVFPDPYTAYAEERWADIAPVDAPAASAPAVALPPDGANGGGVWLLGLALLALFLAWLAWQRRLGSGSGRDPT